MAPIKTNMDKPKMCVQPHKQAGTTFRRATPGLFKVPRAMPRSKSSQAHATRRFLETGRLKVVHQHHVCDLLCSKTCRRQNLPLQPRIFPPSVWPKTSGPNAPTKMTWYKIWLLSLRTDWEVNYSLLCKVVIAEKTSRTQSAWARSRFQKNAMSSMRLSRINDKTEEMHSGQSEQ